MKRHRYPISAVFPTMSHAELTSYQRPRGPIYLCVERLKPSGDISCKPVSTIDIRRCTCLALHQSVNCQLWFQFPVLSTHRLEHIQSRHGRVGSCNFQNPQDPTVSPLVYTECTPAQGKCHSQQPASLCSPTVWLGGSSTVIEAMVFPSGRHPPVNQKDAIRRKQRRFSLVQLRLCQKLAR